MDEHHFDALPPVNPSPEVQSQEPVPESPVSKAGEKEATQATEQAPAGGFIDPAAVSSPDPHVSLQADDSLNNPDDTTIAQPVATPSIADDSDLIEKEWVEKAKQIVEQTKHDPHQQNEEINKVKADYLKKRYNHDLGSGPAAR